MCTCGEPQFGVSAGRRALNLLVICLSCLFHRDGGLGGSWQQECVQQRRFPGSVLLSTLQRESCDGCQDLIVHGRAVLLSLLAPALSPVLGVAAVFAFVRPSGRRFLSLGPTV